MTTSRARGMGRMLYPRVMPRWFAIPLVLALAACPKKSGTTTPDGTGSGSDGPVLVKQTLVRFGTENVAPPQSDNVRTKIWLVLTDETGSAKSFPMEEIDASCAAEAGGELEALGTLRCVKDGVGANYVAVARGSEIILLRQRVAPGEDDNDYEEQSRVAVPAGSKLVFSP